MFSSVWCCFTDIAVPFLSEGTISFFTSNATDHLFGKYAKFSEKLTFLTLWEAQFRKFWVPTIKSDMISVLWKNDGI